MHEQSGLARGQRKHVEFDEAVALAFVLGGDDRAHLERLAGTDGPEKMKVAAHVNPRAEYDALGERVVGVKEQPSRVQLLR